jgi:hypothetical protein
MPPPASPALPPRRLSINDRLRTFSAGMSKIQLALFWTGGY